MLDKIERTKDGVDSLIDRTRDGVIGASERVERKVQATARAAVKQAHIAGERTRKGAEVASLSAHQQVDDAANAIDRGYIRARSGMSRAAASATDYILENPGKAVLFAASSGFVIGLLMRRRRAAD